MRPIRSFRVATIAVCGIGRPRGCRNSAVTANQSASPPTRDASAVARTQPSQGYCASNTRAVTNTTTAHARRPRPPPLHGVELGLPRGVVGPRPGRGHGGRGPPPPPHPPPPVGRRRRGGGVSRRRAGLLFHTANVTPL